VEKPDKGTWIWLAVVGVILLLRWQGGALTTIIAPAKVTAVTYVHEQRAGDIPPAIKAALSKLNERSILATTFDKDTLDKQGGETPEQYKIALAAAKVLPSLVVQAGPRVLNVVEKPTAEQVEAVQ
jgi:hypothetical protein